ncbi:dUTPase domain-containing protein [Cephalotus follicularis]|uniref:Deoxyuridine 5'-triphosphate nucleotidohydrolase n=1 Tax=Cephalotus follicularis TaxID=3775 RepID=A0A1Q3BEF1_CEPFO|nr:dUTPase domain-containing protein [Cephalotus follicularis]
MSHRVQRSGHTNKIMAGKLGALNWKSVPQLAPSSSLYNGILKTDPSFHSLRLKVKIEMALEEPQSNINNSSLETKEPSPKIPKIHSSGNGVHQHVSQNQPISLFKVKKLSTNAVLPSRASPLAAGYDLSSATETKVPARGKALVPTDLSIAIPEGTYARIAPRSGLAWKHSIDVGAGVIDGDYRGAVGVILFNHSDVDFEVKVGDRIAQLIIEKIMTPEVLVVEDLDSTARGDGGFGSTGV